MKVGGERCGGSRNECSSRSDSSDSSSKRRRRKIMNGNSKWWNSGVKGRGNAINNSLFSRLTLLLLLLSNDAFTSVSDEWKLYNKRKNAPLCRDNYWLLLSSVWRSLSVDYGQLKCLCNRSHIRTWFILES